MEKKVFIKLSAFLAAVFILVGCTGLDVINPSGLKLNKAYTFTAEITHGDNCVTSEFERISEGRWNASIIEPYELQGVTMYYKDGKVKASYSGITIDLTDIPEVSAIADRIVYTVESAIKSEGTEITKKSGQIEITGNSEFGAYKLILDAKSKVPVSAELPEQNITIKFSNVLVSNISVPEVVEIP